MDDIDITAFAPAAFYKMKVMDRATGKEHLYVILDLGDGNDGKPFPVVINGIGGFRLPMEIVFDSAKTPEFYVYERTALEAGPEADRLRAARPADAAPVHSGDASIVVQKVVLGKPLP